MWDKGMADAYEGAPPRYTGNSAYMDGYNYGQDINSRYDHEPEPQPPEPTDEDICGGSGHPIHGRDEIGWRCYCGERRYEEKPIPFVDEMVRALLAGRKTQTRRVIDWTPLEPGLNLGFSGLSVGHYNTGVPESGYVLYSRDGRGCWNQRTKPIHCPYPPGTVLWVKEAVRICGSDSDGAPLMTPPVWYLADGDCSKDEYPYLRQARFMPRWAARLFLLVESVRVERVQEINEADAQAEGVPPEMEIRSLEDRNYSEPFGYRYAFTHLWDSINAKRGRGWDANPWVFVYALKVMNDAAR